MQKKTVIVIRGLPGSGKSTYVSKNHGDAVVCSADSFFVGADGEYHFVGHQVPVAHQHCWGEFIDAVAAGHEVIVVDNTNTCVWEYDNYLRLARHHGYETCVVRMHFEESDVPALAERNIHGVPLEGIRAMFGRFEDDEREEIVEVSA